MQVETKQVLSLPKGPIKMIAKELSRYCPVILTDEYCTSKICSACKNSEVDHPIIKYQKIKKIKDEKTGKRKRVKVIEERKSHKLCYCKCNINLSTKKIGLYKFWSAKISDFSTLATMLPEES
jgi:hypothetical protein